MTPQPHDDSAPSHDPEMPENPDRVWERFDRPTGRRSNRFWWLMASLAVLFLLMLLVALVLGLWPR